MKNLIENRKAYFNNIVEEKYTAGIQLIGTEIKSIRNGGLSFVDSYCLFVNDELYLRGTHISIYESGDPHDVTRDRKLLLNKKELKKIHNKVKEKGYTIIPLKGYFNENRFFKVEIGVCKGKKNYDKRESIKKKDSDRELRRSLVI